MAGTRSQTDQGSDEQRQQVLRMQAELADRVMKNEEKMQSIEDDVRSIKERMESQDKKAYERYSQLASRLDQLLVNHISPKVSFEGGPSTPDLKGNKNTPGSSNLVRMFNRGAQSLEIDPKSNTKKDENLEGRNLGSEPSVRNGGTNMQFMPRT